MPAATKAQELLPIAATDHAQTLAEPLGRVLQPCKAILAARQEQEQ